MPSRQTNPDRHGRFRVRDKKNRYSGTWSTTAYNPDTMTLVPNANASDGYGRALPEKPYKPKPLDVAPDSPAPAGDNTTEGESDDD